MKRKYDNSYRRLLAVGRRELRHLRRAGKPRAERRRVARGVELPYDRKCPVCGEVKLKSRQWVVGRHSEHPAVCLACYRNTRETGD